MVRSLLQRNSMMLRLSVQKVGLAVSLALQLLDFIAQPGNSQLEGVIALMGQECLRLRAILLQLIGDVGEA